jgi:hypothetical protein
MSLLKTILALVFVFQAFASDVEHLNRPDVPTVQGIQRFAYIGSTVISSWGYDQATGTLELEFKDSGAVYQYFNVPGEVIDTARNMEMKPQNGSFGQYFHAEIRPVFFYKRVDVQPVIVQAPVEQAAPTAPVRRWGVVGRRMTFANPNGEPVYGWIEE